MWPMIEHAVTTHSNYQAIVDAVKTLVVTQPNHMCVKTVKALEQFRTIFIIISLLRRKNFWKNFNGKTVSYLTHDWLLRFTDI